MLGNEEYGKMYSINRLIPFWEKVVEHIGKFWEGYEMIRYDMFGYVMIQYDTVRYNTIMYTLWPRG